VRGTDDPTLEKTLVMKYEEEVAEYLAGRSSKEGQGLYSAVKPVMMICMTV
jgi:hypothetical protein